MARFTTRTQWRISAVAFLMTAGVVLYWAVDPGAQSQRLLGLAWALWAVLPPIWFLWEWHRFEGDARSEGFETLKYSQELAGKVWLGGLTVLTVLHVGPGS